MTTFTHLTSIKTGTPKEETYYISEMGEVIGWRANDEPWCYDILINETPFDPTDIIEAWSDTLYDCVNNGLDWNTLKTLHWLSDNRRN
jgi:hypothetical protein